jgi:hypothetical protein
MNSPHFSNFRELMDLWNEAEPILNLKVLLESNGLVLFFKKDNKIYGAPEQSRLTLARMKNPDDSSDEEWSKEANFSAYDLEDSTEGKFKKVMFGHKDLEKIKIIDQEKAEKELSKKDKKMPEIDEEEENADSNKARNMINFGEK